MDKEELQKSLDNLYYEHEKTCRLRQVSSITGGVEVLYGQPMCTCKMLEDLDYQEEILKRGEG